MPSRSVSFTTGTQMPIVAVWVICITLFGAASVSGAALWRLSDAEARVSKLETKGDRLFVKVTNIQATLGVMAEHWKIPVPPEEDPNED